MRHESASSTRVQISCTGASVALARSFSSSAAARSAVPALEELDRGAAQRLDVARGERRAVELERPLAHGERRAQAGATYSRAGA